MSGLVRVRVRGIYATAITKILLDEGFQIVQASAQISSRFGIPQIPAAADVTVKSVEDDASRLLVIGYPEKTEAVVTALNKYLDSSLRWKSRLELYSTVVAKIERLEGHTCVAKVGDIELEVVDKHECKEGEFIIGWVVKAPVFPGERGKLSIGVRVVGDYAMMYESASPRVTMSEHIRDAGKRALLSSLAYDYTREGLSVHWRSSARDAEESVLREELARLKEMLSEAKRRAEELASRGEVGIVSKGETLYIYELSSLDKRRLDEVRNAVIPTIPLHHTIKSLGDEKMNTIVDYAEYVLRKDSGLSRILYEGMLDYIVEQLQGKRVKIEHVKPDGNVINLGVGVVREARVKGEAIVVRVERVVKSYGVYDGLGVEKEPGDVIESVFDTSMWTVRHVYRSREGEVKGEYININTPPEIVPGRIRYIDLVVDVVKRPDGSLDVVDVEELIRYVREGIVPPWLVDKVKEVVKEIAGVEIKV